MLTCLGFGPKCVAMVNTLFSNASALVLVNNSLTSRISLHHSIQQGCPLALYLYVLTTDDLGYLLEAAHIQGQVKGIKLLNGSELVNNHFADDSLLSMSVEQELVEGALSCLATFCTASGLVVNNHKTKFWFVGRDSPPEWIPTDWMHIWPRVIVRYLGIPFGMGLSPVAMWDWCLQKLQGKLHTWYHKDLPLAEEGVF